MKIKAAVSYEHQAPLVIDELDLAEPRENEVLVKVVGCGICATDISCIRDGLGGLNSPPIVLGHEGSGIVEKVGPGVTEFVPGDHVIISYPYCGECDFCRKGKVWFCNDGLKLINGGAMADGFSPLSKDGKPIHNYFGASCFADHLVSNTKNLVKVDPEIDLRYVGPMACGCMTGTGAVLNSIQPEPGSSIVVFGLGAIGMGAVMAANISRCTTIIAVDIVDSRLEAALKCGATHVINSSNVDIVEEIMRITDGQGADYAVEGSGATPCVKAAYAATKTEATIAMVGVSHKVVFDNFFFDIYSKRTVSINMGNAHPKLFIPQILDWYKRGLFPMENIVTFYPLEKINDAIEDSKSGATIKPVILFE